MRAIYQETERFFWAKRNHDCGDVCTKAWTTTCLSCDAFAGHGEIEEDGSRDNWTKSGRPCYNRLLFPEPFLILRDPGSLELLHACVPHCHCHVWSILGGKSAREAARNISSREEMEITTLPLAPSVRAKLLSAGYTSSASLASVSPSQLARDLNISDNEAVAILKVTSQYTTSDRLDGSHSILAGAQTAWDKLLEEEHLTRITTSCEDLDAILGGGINCKEITEIGGVPGIGKTQLGIQLAINVQIPNDYGGLGGKAIYIDTEGSFMVERAFQIAEACIQDTFNDFDKNDFEAYEEKMQPKAFLANIFYYRICSHTEQVAVINYLDKFIAEHKDVKIVVIDSVTFHFRQEFDDLALRTRLLGGMALKLMKLAQKYRLAVVLLNQVTTKVTEGSFHLTLALGDSWAHACTNRIILYWNGNERYAHIDKSPSLRSASAPFSVTSKGIRSLVSNCRGIKMM